MIMGMYRCFEQGTVVTDLASIDKFGALCEQTTGLGRGVAVAE
jgi:hypothetical protein